MPDFTSQSATAARDLLIEQHQSYLRALAVEIMKSMAVRVDLKELVAYGQVGLIEAAERYDSRRAVSFTTFAYYRIKGAIYDGLREMGVHTRTPKARAQFAANDLRQTAVDDEPNNAASGGLLNLDDAIAEVQSAIDTLLPVFLLSLESGEALLEIVASDQTVLERIEQREIVVLMRSFVETMPIESRQVIEAIYFKDRSMVDLAAQLNVHRSWISRLHARAIKHLRDQMQHHGLIDSS